VVKLVCIAAFVRAVISGVLGGGASGASIHNAVNRALASLFRSRSGVDGLVRSHSVYCAEGNACFAVLGGDVVHGLAMRLAFRDI
jgi:hypothetical protein